jgi:hypothetical protein
MEIQSRFQLLNHLTDSDGIQIISLHWNLLSKLDSRTQRFNSFDNILRQTKASWNTKHFCSNLLLVISTPINPHTNATQQCYFNALKISRERYICIWDILLWPRYTRRGRQKHFHFTVTNIKYMNNTRETPNRRDLMLNTGITEII